MLQRRHETVLALLHRRHTSIHLQHQQGQQRREQEHGLRLYSRLSCRSASFPIADENSVCQRSTGVGGLKGSGGHGSEEGPGEEGQGLCAPSQGEHQSVCSCFSYCGALACAMHVLLHLHWSWGLVLLFTFFCSPSLWRMRRRSQRCARRSRWRHCRQWRRRQPLSTACRIKLLSRLSAVFWSCK